MNVTLTSTKTSNRHFGTFEGVTETEHDITGEIVLKHEGATVARYNHCTGWTLADGCTSVLVAFEGV